MADMGIGRLAELTGVKVPTIRYYEQNGLVPSPRRSEGGQRRYDESAVRRLHFIRHARDLGFDIKEIHQLLALSERPAMPCHTATEIARHHLKQVEDKITRLGLIRSQLKLMIKACAGGSIAECRILEAIAHEVSPQRKNRLSRRARDGALRTRPCQSRRAQNAL